MAKICMFALGDSIAVASGQNNAPQLVSPKTVLRPTYVPSSFSFGLIVGVRGVELDQELKVSFGIKDPDGVSLEYKGDLTLAPISGTESLPSEYQGFMLTLDIRNLDLEKQGLYHFTLSINGEDLEEQEIPVFRKPENE